MKKNFIISFLLFIVLIISIFSGIYYKYEYILLDFMFNIFPIEKKANKDIVLIAIDQAGIDKIGEETGIYWPWPRIFYAKVLDFLKKGEAKTVLFDILFESPDIDRVDISGPISDEIFSQSLKNFGNAYLATYFFPMEKTTNFDVEKYFPKIEDKIGLIKNTKFNALKLPYEKYINNCAGLGLVDFSYSDKIFRKIILCANNGNYILPHLSISHLAKSENSDIKLENKRIIIGNKKIPIDKKGYYLINWYGEGKIDNAFKYYSFRDILDSQILIERGEKPIIEPEIFKNKIVIIGSNAPGLGDMKTTPVSKSNTYAGMEIYATIISNILNNNFIKEVHFSFIIILFVIFAIINFLFYSHSGLNFWKYFIYIFLIILLTLGISLLLFKFYRIWFPVTFLITLIFTDLFLKQIIGIIEARKEKKKLRDTFSKYLHPKLVEEIVNNKEEIGLGGKKVEATLMFLDIQNFTGISEKMEPENLVKQLNEYLNIITNIILDNNGFLDKYTGDGLMAIFGVPIIDKNHAKNAVKSALEIMNVKFDIKISENEIIPLISRIGLNSGPIVAGNIGSNRRMDYTAIGDTVNLASRLEGVNKIFSTNIIYSETTKNLLDNEFIDCEIDSIRVKGKELPVNIYTPINFNFNNKNDLDNFIIEYGKARNLYKNKNWEEAKKIYLQLFKKYNLKFLEKLANRCDEIITNPNVIDEFGVYIMHTK